MNKSQIFILVLFLTGGGIAAYFIIKKKREQQASQTAASALQAASDASALQKIKNDFCNPPFSNVYEKLAYQKKLAEAEWDKLGRGMDLDYFFQQYKSEMGCP